MTNATVIMAPNQIKLVDFDNKVCDTMNSTQHNHRKDILGQNSEVNTKRTTVNDHATAS